MEAIEIQQQFSVLLNVSGGDSGVGGGGGGNGQAHAPKYGAWEDEEDDEEFDD